jgi:hypothetical protein
MDTIALAGGKIFYVDSVNGADGNSGRDPDAALLTVEAALVACTANNNDIVVLLPKATGYALAAAVDWNKAYTHLVGAWAPNARGARCRVTAAAGIATNMWTVSVAGCVFQNIKFSNSSNTAASGAVVVTSGRNNFFNCKMEAMMGATSAASATAYTLKFTGSSAEECYFKNCVIGQDTILRSTANADVVFSGGVRDIVFEDCQFIALTGATEYWLDLSLASCIDGTILFKNCVFLNSTKSGGTAMTLGFKVNAAGIGGLVILQNCVEFGASDFCANTAGAVIVFGAASGATAGQGIAAHTS